MTKVYFSTLMHEPTLTELADLVASQFELTSAAVLATMQARRALGDTLIAPDVDMPHVELPNLAEQGLIWLVTPTKYFLIFIVDTLAVDANLISILTDLLDSNGLAKLRNVKSQLELDRLLRGLGHANG